MSARGRRPSTLRDGEIVALAREGLSRSQIAKRLLLSAVLVCRAVKRLGIRVRDARGDHVRGGHDQGRADDMARRYAAGETLAEIGASYGITRERVRQIIRDRTSLKAGDGGQAVKVRRRREARATKQDEKYMARLGCGWEEYKRIRALGRDMRRSGRGTYQAPLAAFMSQRRNAANRKIGWDLTFWQWWSIWQDSGRWEQRGRGQGYVMCRRGDVGPYSVGNVFITTAIENTSSSKHKRSGLPTGVTLEKSGRFSALRTINGRRVGLGTFATAGEAYAAYVAAAPGLKRHRSSPIERAPA